MSSELATIPPDDGPLPYAPAPMRMPVGHIREVYNPAAPAHPEVIVPADLYGHWLAGRSPRTSRAYAADLADFARHLQCRSGLDALELLLAVPATAANAWVLGYRNAMLARGLASATIARRLAALRSVVEMAHMLGLVTWNIEIKAPKIEARRDVRGPDKGDRKRLWKYLRSLPDTPRSRRDRAIVALLFDLGLRRGEVVGLEVADLDQVAGELAVVGKGRREKVRLTLPPATLAALAAWIESRPRDPGSLFGLTGEAIRLVCRRLGTAAGLARPLRPHGLRHAAITAALDSGSDIRRVRKFSRHAKLETVIRYDDARDDAAGEIAKNVSRERK